jgi:hypothetical protein
MHNTTTSNEIFAKPPDQSESIDILIAEPFDTEPYIMGKLSNDMDMGFTISKMNLLHESDT